MPRNVTVPLEHYHEPLAAHVPSYSTFDTCQLALASPEHCWSWLAAVSSSLNPLEQEPEMLHKLEVICSREFLTEEQKSLVGRMAGCLNSGLQLLSPREDRFGAIWQALAKAMFMGLGHSFGQVTWRMMVFSEGSCCCERDPLQLWLPLVWEWLHLHTPGLGQAHLAELVLLWKPQAPSQA